jgi:penicillin amidase
MTRLVTFLTAAAVALTAATASAGVRQSGSVLPPGQSGFVSAAGLATGSGSPHLTDQTELFNGFGFKNSALGQPGPYESTESPRAGVTITRDSYGVPSITGQTAYDTWFGTGYAAAQDRLVQFEFFRRATQGRLGEILGTSYRDDDFIARRDFYTRAELDAQFQKLPAEFKERFNAYTDGVNAWIARVRIDPSQLPGEFGALGVLPADWTIYDSLSIGVFLARTVPSGDGAELQNARALKGAGTKNFEKLLPLRTPGAVPTVPKEDGSFPSQPGRSRKQEKAAFARSRKFLDSIELPARPAPEKTSELAARRHQAMAGIGRTGGSSMWAIRMPGGAATFFNGPQLGFQIPELFVELEIHGPGINVRGATAPGVPVIATGHNEHVAWGVTSGLNDDDDLYVEQLAGGDESYTYRGQQRQMECRDETFNFRAQPTSPGGPPVATETRRICRTLHGPVQERSEGRAFARRYAIWGREMDTLAGLAEINAADDIEDVDAAVDKLTWNENLMAADDKGNIGYWHPGLLQLVNRGWDERLPLPGTGEAEWRGFLPPDRRPQVVNPKQGYLFNWNNVPSADWTNGDTEARERATGKFHRAAWLGRQVKAAHRAGGGYDRSQRVDYNSGTIAQQRPLVNSELKRARKKATGTAAELLDVLIAWKGSYVKVDGNNTVDPGVAAWEQFKESAVRVAMGRLPTALQELDGGASSSHEFDIRNAEAYALRGLSERGYRQAAKLAHRVLAKRFGTSDTSKWREPRRIYEPSAQGAGSFPAPFYFFDRGTFQHNNELGP